MGQKVHPNGFRVGFTRKWDHNWFALGAEWKKLFFYQKEVESFFRLLFHYYSYTKISRRKRVFLFDVKFFKYTLNKLFLFVFFYKLRTKRRKDVRAIIKKSGQDRDQFWRFKGKKKKSWVKTKKFKRKRWRKYKYLLRFSFWAMRLRSRRKSKSLNYMQYKI